MIYFNGYCPESELNARKARMRLNDDDFYESEATGLQVAIPYPGVEAVILRKRGTGKFREKASYADELNSGECLAEQTKENFPFSDSKLIEDAEQLTRYLENIQLSHLRTGLKVLEDKNPTLNLQYVRHFDCKGNPYNCQLFLIGINPSLGLPFGKKFDDYWSNQTGFALEDWLQDYKEDKLRGKKHKTLIGTRPRIEILRKAFGEKGLDLLNCNVYPTASKRFNKLASEKKTEPIILKLLLDEIKPKIFILHGGIVKKRFAEVFEGLYTADQPDWQLHEFLHQGEKKYIISVPHLYNMPFAENANGHGVSKMVSLVLNAWEKPEIGQPK